MWDTQADMRVRDDAEGFELEWLRKVYLRELVSRIE